jgi:hypothetical protein
MFFVMTLLALVVTAVAFRRGLAREGFFEGTKRNCSFPWVPF